MLEAARFDLALLLVERDTRIGLTVGARRGVAVDALRARPGGLCRDRPAI